MTQVALIAAGNTHVRSEHPQVRWGDPGRRRRPEGCSAISATPSPARRSASVRAHELREQDGDAELLLPQPQLSARRVQRRRRPHAADCRRPRGRTACGSANCPTVAVTDDVPDPASRCRRCSTTRTASRSRRRFPGGFTPQMGGSATDASLVAGVRGSTAGGIDWDLSGSVGTARTPTCSSTTPSTASLGPASPTSFDIGGNRQRESQFPLRRFVCRHRPRSTSPPAPNGGTSSSASVAGRPRGVAGRPLRPAALHVGRQRVLRVRAAARRRLEPLQRRGLRRPRGERTGTDAWTLGGRDLASRTSRTSGRRRTARYRGSLRLRPGQREQRIPGAHARASRTASTSRAGSTRPSATSSTTRSFPSISAAARLRGGAAAGAGAVGQLHRRRGARHRLPSRSPPTTSASTCRIGSGSRATSCLTGDGDRRPRGGRVRGGGERAGTSGFFTNAFATSSQGIDVVSTYHAARVPRATPSSTRSSTTPTRG